MVGEPALGFPAGQTAILLKLSKFFNFKALQRLFKKKKQEKLFKLALAVIGRSQSISLMESGPSRSGVAAFPGLQNKWK